MAAAIGIGVGVLGSGTSGESFHSALAATDLAPGANGEATLTKTSSGWRIELDATRLPRLEGGRFYEAWLRNRAGVLVPVGTFNEGTEGHALGRRFAAELHDDHRDARAG